jgi:SNF2 family DNA or RNA helicase
MEDERVLTPDEPNNLPKLRSLPGTLGEAGRRAQAAGLYPFQIEGVEWLAGRKYALLADEMGLGKTVQALLALPPGCPALVVCPASLKYNWAEEVRRWRGDFTATVLEGKNPFRLPRPGEVVVVNYERLSARLDYPQMLYQDEESPGLSEVCLVLDEAHLVKNRNAKRTRQARVLVRGARSAWGLTGTPLLGRPEDLYDVLNTLGLAEVLAAAWK